jgi:hypothetical protein
MQEPGHDNDHFNGLARFYKFSGDPVRGRLHRIHALEIRLKGRVLGNLEGEIHRGRPNRVTRAVRRYRGRLAGFIYFSHMAL